MVVGKVIVTGISSWLSYGNRLMDFSDEQLIKAWKELPEKERLMLYLIDVEQLSPENVAAIVRRPVVIVNKRTDWARVLLKKELRSLSRSGDSLEMVGTQACNLKTQCR